MKALRVLLIFAAACSTVPAQPQRPGYLGLGVTYHRPDPEKPGWLLVMHVPDDGPAFRAGLKPQTVITAVNGRPLQFADRSAMLEWYKTIRPGQRIRLTLAGDAPREVVLVAAEMPPDKLRIWQANFEPAPARPPR